VIVNVAEEPPDVFASGKTGALVCGMRFIHGKPPTVRVSGPARILQNAGRSFDQRQSCCADVLPGRHSIYS
jgi:hypothetical protein